MLATKTPETNVGSKSDYFPVVTSTRMFFPETDDITEFYFQCHSIVILPGQEPVDFFVYFQCCFTGGFSEICIS